MIDWAMVLDYLKVFTAAPVVLGVMVFMFRGEVSGLLLRVSELELLGGKLKAKQKDIPEVRGESEKIQVAPDKVDQKELVPLEGDPDNLRKALHGANVHARLWEYRYLNYFLVPRTLQVLEWLIRWNDNGVTTEGFLSAWMESIPQADERRAVLSALESHSLIVERDGRLIVTPKGKEYMEWRGPLPPVNVK